jgi:bifunctional enzyme CysN/CysC
MDHAARSPLEQLESEAISLIRETAALFERPAVLVDDRARSAVLARLAARAFGGGPSPLARVEASDSDHDAFLRADAGAGFEVWPLFGKPPPPGGAWDVYPLASWSQHDIEAYLGGGLSQDQRRLLRLCTVGGPGTGKSTLVRGLAAASLEPGYDCFHKHVLTAERRLFLIDPPGQEPYSHGLMAAASTAEAALLVVDVQRGLTTATRRQIFLLALMGVPHLVVVINKMDLVGYSRAAYEDLVAEGQALSTLVEVKNLSFVPTAAEEQANLTSSSSSMPWYEGAPLLGHLESITPGSLKNLTDLRLPIQGVQRQPATAILGRLASGRLALGDRVVLLPSGRESEVARLSRGAGSDCSAMAGDSVSLTLRDELEARGGDMVAAPQNLPSRSSEIEAIMLWLGQAAQRGETMYLLHHGTRLVCAHVCRVLSCLDAETLCWTSGRPLSKGDIGRVRLTTATPLYFDSYTGNREMGSFALLDPASRAVLGAGVLRGPAIDLPDVTAMAERLSSSNVVADPTLIGLEQRASGYGHRPAVLWFTGLSGSGKSTLAKEVERRLFQRGCHTLFLDGDNVRSGLNGDLGFTEEARTESNRRVGELAALAYQQGQIVICSFISGKRSDRAFVRSLLPREGFYELFVSCPLEVCRGRDPKKLYQRAEAGELLAFSGVSIPYEAPARPDLELPSHREPVQRSADRVLALLENRSVLPPTPS